MGRLRVLSGSEVCRILQQMGSRCAGDGLFAAFDGPARAIRCACRIRDEVRTLGLEVRSGLHAGECEVVADKNRWYRGPYRSTRSGGGAARSPGLEYREGPCGRSGDRIQGTR